jgi:hypothetical protein
VWCVCVCVCLCVFVCDLETSTVRRSKPQWGCCATERKIEVVTYLDEVGHKGRVVDIHKLCTSATVCSNSVLFV